MCIERKTFPLRVFHRHIPQSWAWHFFKAFFVVVVMKSGQSKLGRLEKMRIKNSARVPSGEFKAAMLWRQGIVLRISKSGNAPDCRHWKTVPFVYRLISKSLLPPLAPRVGHLNVVFVSSVIRVGFLWVRKIKIPVNHPIHACMYSYRQRYASSKWSKFAVDSRGRAEWLSNKILTENFCSSRKINKSNVV